MVRGNLDKQRIGTSISKKTRSDKFQTKLDPEFFNLFAQWNDPNIHNNITNFFIATFALFSDIIITFRFFWYTNVFFLLIYFKSFKYYKLQYSMIVGNRFPSTISMNNHPKTN